MSEANPVVESLVKSITCCDLWHPGLEKCDSAGIELLSVCSSRTVKIYAALYLIPHLLKKKSLCGAVKQMIPDVARSASFLTCNCFLVGAAHCVIRKILGRYTCATVAFVPTLIGSFTAIHIEKLHRQEILAIYMSSLALETLYEMAVLRKVIPPLIGGEVALFALSSAVLCHFHRTKEVKINDTMEMLMDRLLSCPYPCPNPSFLTVMREALVSQVEKVCQSRGSQCTHSLHCVSNVVNSGINGLVLGTGIQLFLKLLSSGGSIRQVVRMLNKPGELARISTFVGLFSAGAVGLECALKSIGVQYNALISGAVAGLTFSLFPGPSGPVALYFFCRAFQCVYKKLILDETIIEIPYDTILLYTISSAVTVHIGVCEPHLMRPSYSAFLNYLTNNKYQAINKDALSEVLGGLSAI